MAPIILTYCFCWLLFRYSVAIMVDTEGSEVHTAVSVPVKCEVGFKGGGPGAL